MCSPSAWRAEIPHEVDRAVVGHDGYVAGLDPALDALPPVSDRRLAVRVTPDALRQVRAGHPWVYDQSVASVRPDGSVGDLAVVFDRRRRFAGIGLFDPGSPIRLKMLHAGGPVPIDEGWYRSRLSESMERRRPLLDGPDGALGALRLVSGENDGLPGLVVDRYADVLVVKLYSAIWWPWLRCIVEQLLELTAPSGVVLRLARLLQDDDAVPLRDGDVIAGAVPSGPVRFSEAGLLFDADVRRGQKTGHFLDQRGNRIAVGAMTEGRDVLDVFTSTGGFSVHAAAGGATSVHGVDLSGPTLAAAERNVALNSHLPRVAACRYTTEVGDAFEVMGRMSREGRRFDLVVVDPPAFAQRQDRVESALRAYARLTGLACSLLRRGGVLVQASCSSRVTDEQFHGAVGRAAIAAGHVLHEIARSGHELDHPIGFPEGGYLKAGFWTVER